MRGDSALKLIWLLLSLSHLSSLNQSCTSDREKARLNTQGKTEVKDSRVLIFGVIRLPTIFDPGRAPSTASVSIASLLHRNLLKVDQYNTIRADLARRWLVSRDFKKFNLCIEKARFHDGSVLTSSDIAYSINRFLSEDNQYYLSNMLRRLSPIIETSDSKVHSDRLCINILLKEPMKDFLKVLASPRFAIVKNNSRETDPIGLGSYRLRQPSSPEQVIFESVNPINTNYDRIVFIKLPDNAETFKSVADGEIDLYFGVTDDQKVPLSNDRLKVTFIKSLMATHLIYNLKRPFAQAYEFRKDFSALIQYLVVKHIARFRIPKYHPHLVPANLMPREYYKIQPERIEPSQFIERWRKQGFQRNFVLVGATNEFPPEFIGELRSILQNIGMELDYVSDFYGKTMEVLNSLKYDAAIGGYHSEYDRAEAFAFMVDTMIRNTVLDHKIVDKFMIKFQIIQNISDDSERDIAFMKDVLWLENQHIFVPLFSGNLPIIHSNKITLVQNRFRYFTDINSIQKRVAK